MRKKTNTYKSFKTNATRKLNPVRRKSPLRKTTEEPAVLTATEQATEQLTSVSDIFDSAVSEDNSGSSVFASALASMDVWEDDMETEALPELKIQEFSFGGPQEPEVVTSTPDQEAQPSAPFSDNPVQTEFPFGARYETPHTQPKEDVAPEQLNLFEHIAPNADTCSEQEVVEQLLGQQTGPQEFEAHPSFVIEGLESAEGDEHILNIMEQIAQALEGATEDEFADILQQAIEDANAGSDEPLFVLKNMSMPMLEKEDVVEKLLQKRREDRNVTVVRGPSTAQ